MKKLIEQELIRRGYDILFWHSTLKNGWVIKVEKDGNYSTIYLEEIVNELLEDEINGKY